MNVLAMALDAIEPKMSESFRAALEQPNPIYQMFVNQAQEDFMAKRNQKVSPMGAIPPTFGPVGSIVGRMSCTEANLAPEKLTKRQAEARGCAAHLKMLAFSAQESAYALGVPPLDTRLAKMVREIPERHLRAVLVETLQEVLHFRELNRMNTRERGEAEQQNKIESERREELRQKFVTLREAVALANSIGQQL